MTRTKARMCDGKKRHDTRRAPVGAMFALVRGKGAALAQLSVYRCPHCAGFHVGHRERGRRP